MTLLTAVDFHNGVYSVTVIGQSRLLFVCSSVRSVLANGNKTLPGVPALSGSANFLLHQSNGALCGHSSYLNGHYSWNDRHSYANFPTVFQELEKSLVLEEKLGDDEVGTCVHFFLEVSQVFLIAGTVRVTIRITYRKAFTKLLGWLYCSTKQQQTQL